MTTRSNAPIVLGVDSDALEGRTLRWAAEQAHLEGRRLKLVTAYGPVLAARREFSKYPRRPGIELRWGGTVLDRARSVCSTAT